MGIDQVVEVRLASSDARRPQFRGPSNPPWNVDTADGRRLAAERYMAAAVEAGVEILALADHNDAEWIGTMIEAGNRAGVVVFPGVEITTGSGADGVHLIIIGDQTRTRDDFNTLLSGVCGYNEDHPRFDPVSNNPASSPRTAIDILDDLPEGYLVVAPHVFNDNGLMSRNTVAGDVRWKILHHDRLGALDIGDPRTLTDPASWKSRFVKRELDHFPSLPGLAFVSTSDAYALSDLGSRWTWIRLSVPTIEGLDRRFSITKLGSSATGTSATRLPRRRTMSVTRGFSTFRSPVSRRRSSQSKWRFTRA